MDPRLQMAIQQSIQSAEMSELTTAILLPCWKTCADTPLTRKDFTNPEGISDALSQKVSACNRKCIARNFEVMELMMNVRTLREKEMMQGLAPGTLTSELL